MSDLSLAQAQLFPLRKENARLARENHELHLDHIKQNEESRYELDKFAQKSRELSDQITEQRLMNKLYEDQIKEKDEVIEKLREVLLLFLCRHKCVIYSGLVDIGIRGNIRPCLENQAYHRCKH